MQIPLGYMQKETYHENQENEFYKIKDEQNRVEKKGPPYYTISCHGEFLYYSKADRLCTFW